MIHLRTTLFLVAILAGLAGCSSAQRANEGPKLSEKEMAKLHVELGTAAFLRGDFSLAVQDLRKAIEKDPANTTAHNHLGLAYYALGNADFAKSEFERAIKEDKNNSDAYINLGNLYSEKNKKAEARLYYNKALENLEYKMRHRALTNLAQLSLSENKTEDARTLLYRSLQVNPDYCLSHFLLGTIFSREGNSGRAAGEFSKSVVKTCVNNPEGHLQLGMAYMKLRDYKKARQEFVFLVEEFPQTKQARRAGEQLRSIP